MSERKCLNCGGDIPPEGFHQGPRHKYCCAQCRKDFSQCKRRGTSRTEIEERRRARKIKKARMIEYIRRGLTLQEISDKENMGKQGACSAIYARGLSKTWRIARMRRQIAELEAEE